MHICAYVQSSNYMKVAAAMPLNPKRTNVEKKRKQKNKTSHSNVRQKIYLYSFIFQHFCCFAAQDNGYANATYVNGIKRVQPQRFCNIILFLRVVCFYFSLVSTIAHCLCSVSILEWFRFICCCCFSTVFISKIICFLKTNGMKSPLAE